MKKIYFLVIFSLILVSCGDKSTNVNEPLPIASCEGCHTNYQHLVKVHSPDTALPSGGCGGEAPHYEPYDRVYMGGVGYEKFKKSSHYKIGCTGCHNGVDKTDDKNLAHSGNFIAHPSLFAKEKCASCHNDIVNNFASSLHNGYGQMRKVAIRSGFSNYKDFEKLPAHQKEGYNKNCATCHASCGTCHIIRPSAGGGGLLEGHNFIKEPDMIKVCVACHSSRGGHAFLGVGSGTKPDVHQTKGMTCITCHKGQELHGDGQFYDHRYAYSKLPKCEDCHNDMEQKNPYHTYHINDFNCQGCHSQNYNNCGSCHIHGLGARIPSYMDFKIALNPLPDVKSKYKYSVVRRTLAAPDNWIEYGVASYSNFDALPTYNYATPHNIQRWTERTKVPDGKKCYWNCHVRRENDTLVNTKNFLFEENLLDWEKNATRKITVNNALPKDWFK